MEKLFLWSTQLWFSTLKASSVNSFAKVVFFVCDEFCADDVSEVELESIYDFGLRCMFPKVALQLSLILLLIISIIIGY